MNDNYEVYLAGHIKNFHDAVSDRKYVKERLEALNIKCRSPMRGKQCILNYNRDSSKVSEYFSKNEICLRDLYDIESVDVVLVMTGDAPSWGTSGEFWYATFVCKTPTLVISEKPSLWLKKYATKIVENLDEAIEVLEFWSVYWNGSGVYDME